MRSKIATLSMLASLMMLFETPSASADSPQFLDANAQIVSALADSPTPTAAQAFLHDATTKQQAVTLSVVSTDPYTNPDTYHRTQVEPETFSFGSTIVSAFQTGRSLEWGASNLGWSVSTDTGTTWTDGFLPGTTVHATPPGRWERVVDPSVAYDAKHDLWLIEGLGTRKLTGQRDRLFVSVSTDGAQTFGEPIIVARADRSQIFDKNWITCDNTPTSPFYGNCYTAWDNDYDDGHNLLRLHAATSVDGGLTWTAATTPRRSRAFAFGVQPVVQPSGTVVMPTGCYPCFGSFVSTDGGSTYRGPFAMPKVDSRTVHGGLRMPRGLRSVDADAAGTVYAAWHDCRFRDHCRAQRHRHQYVHERSALVLGRPDPNRSADRLRRPFPAGDRGRPSDVRFIGPPCRRLPLLSRRRLQQGHV
jgi:hypothetical protein